MDWHCPSIADLNDYVTHMKGAWELGEKQYSSSASTKLAGTPFSMVLMFILQAPILHCNQ